jgi:hypothetical protein
MLARTSDHCAYSQLSCRTNDASKEVPLLGIMIEIQLSDRYPVQQNIENRANEDGSVPKWL